MECCTRETKAIKTLTTTKKRKQLIALELEGQEEQLGGDIARSQNLRPTRSTTRVKLSDVTLDHEGGGLELWRDTEATPGMGAGNTHACSLLLLMALLYFLTGSQRTRQFGKLFPEHTGLGRDGRKIWSKYRGRSTSISEPYSP